MDIDSCYQLGYVIKPHGLHGDISVFIDADDPQEYKNLESVFIRKDNQLIPFFINKIKINGDKAIVSLEESHDISTAASLKGSAIFLPLTALPDLGGDQFYYHEIIGYKVKDKKIGKVGTVITIYDAGPQNLLAIDHEGKEVLLPLNEQMVIGVDKKARVVSVDIPDGLLDIYLEE